MSVDKLTGRENWCTWSFAVKAFLQLEDLWEVVTGSEIDAKKDTKAKSKIILLIDPMIYIHVQGAQTSKEVWNNLSMAFEDSGLLRRVGLLKDLINTTLDTSLSIEDYLNKILSSAHKLRNIKFSVDDEWLGTLMLAGLPDEYRPMIMALESSGVTINADLIKTKLLQEVKKSENTAFYTKTKNHPPTHFQKNNHQQLSKSKGPRCFNCNKHGHISKNCWFKKNKSDTKNNGFIAAFSAMSFSDSASWYVDSGASMHFTMHRDWLEDETTPPVQNIRIADDKILHVESCGNVTISVPSNEGCYNRILVRNVLYVPELSTNLLSVSKMIKSGCKVEFNKVGCVIYNQNQEKVAEASLINDMYKLNCKMDAYAMAAKSEADIYTWHQRMGHMNFKDLKKISNCASGVKISLDKEDGICISCIEGKQTRQPFPTEGSRATELLERIHSDVCGPMQTASIGHARYLVTFIDDFSRKVFVYFIKNKSEVLDKFIEFKNRVENELNRKIKVLRSDNGKEYINKSFDTYLKKHGILHQTSNPYTPQQNGLSERMNRTLIERAKCMILNADLQNYMWAEAAATACYIVNRSPTHALSDITPEEVWTGTKPNLSNMRVFGCKSMVHVPKENRQKLDPKSRELIFVGYSECTKGYRFMDPKTKRIVMSRDVVFLEATVKRKFINTSMQEDNSIPEKIEIKKVSTKMEKTQICEKKNVVCIPDFENETNNGPDDDDDNGNVTVSTPVTISDSSSSYDDPTDETYIPDVEVSCSTPLNVNRNLRSKRREEIINSMDASFMCMIGESTTSLLNNDPQSLDEALKSDNAEKWKESIHNEYQSLLKNNTWSLVDLPINKKKIPCKWVFKTKTDENGSVVSYKARLVIKGYQQTKGIDYHEIYAPVVRYTSIRYLIGLAVKYGLKICQMDAVTAFLQGDVEEEIFMCQPPLFEHSEKVCKLNKSLYGLKQASRQWNKKLNTALIEIGMIRSKIDPCIYYRILSEDDILFITVYVDDLLYFYKNEETTTIIKEKLKQKFSMKDLGQARQCIGFRIIQNENEISLDQTLYIKKILSRFGMNECKPVSTPCDPNIQLKRTEKEDEILHDTPYQEAIGCLLYLSQGTRPDIAYIVNSLSRFNNQPTITHWTAVKRVFRYLQATKNAKLLFKRDNENITGYCDADWASDSVDRRSCTGYIFIFQGAAISWASKKQQTIALSSTEAEYMSLAYSIQEALWLKQLEESFWPETAGTSLCMYCDNQSAISLSGNETYHARSKHIDVRYHFLREKIACKQISVHYKKTEDMVADVLTKGLHRPKHEAFCIAMGLRPGEDDGTLDANS